MIYWIGFMSGMLSGITLGAMIQRWIWVRQARKIVKDFDSGKRMYEYSGGTITTIECKGPAICTTEAHTNPNKTDPTV